MEKKTATPVLDQNEAQSFNDDEKAAARALSLGADQTDEKRAQPYTQALRCRIALDVAFERFRRSGNLDDQQARSLDQIVAFYDKDIEKFAKIEGKSATELAQDLQQMKEAEVDNVGRTAFACLRKLQS